MKYLYEKRFPVPYKYTRVYPHIQIIPNHRGIHYLHNFKIQTLIPLNKSSQKQKRKIPEYFLINVVCK